MKNKPAANKAHKEFILDTDEDRPRGGAGKEFMAR
jgi:hypothetical protein